VAVRYTSGVLPVSDVPCTAVHVSAFDEKILIGQGIRPSAWSGIPPDISLVIRSWRYFENSGLMGAMRYSASLLAASSVDICTAPVYFVTFSVPANDGIFTDPASDGIFAFPARDVIFAAPASDEIARSASVARTSARCIGIVRSITMTWRISGSCRCGLPREQIK
jgi:hypothetical protein